MTTYHDLTDMVTEANALVSRLSIKKRLWNVVEVLPSYRVGKFDLLIDGKSELLCAEANQVETFLMGLRFAQESRNRR